MMRLIRSERDGGSPMTLAQMCKALNVSRAAFYRWTQPKIDRDMDIRAAMHDAALAHPWYGYRPMTHDLRRRGFRINEKRIRRLMRLDNLVGSRRSLRRYLTAK
jgi:transposase InsO family protein